MFFSAESPQRGFSVPPLAVCEKKETERKRIQSMPAPGGQGSMFKKPTDVLGCFEIIWCFFTCLDPRPP